MLISAGAKGSQLIRAAAACVLLASVGAASAETLRVGVLLDFDDPFDAQRFEAMQAAASDYNESAESKVVLERHDMEHGSALEALRAAHAGGEGPSMYLGPTYSGDVESVLGYVGDNSLTLISPSSSATHLAVPGDGVFRLTPPVHLEAGVLASMMSEYGTAVVAVQRGPFGADVLRDMRAALGEQGVEAVVAAEFEPDGSDWDAALDGLESALSGAGPDAAVLMISGFESEIESMLSSASERGIEREWFVPSGALYPEPGAAAPTGGISTLAVEARGPAADRVDSLMESAGAEPSVYDYSAYDSVLVAAAAARMAAGEDASFSVPAAALSVSGALGEIRLDAAGDLRSARYGVWESGGGAWSRAGEASPPASFCAGAPGPGSECVKIGALVSGLPELGDGSKLAAMEAAADAHNRERLSSGLGGPYVDIAPYAFEPGSAGAAVERGIADGVVLYAGPTTSPDLEDALSHGGIVLASPSSSASSLSLEDGAFRLTPSTARESSVLAGLVAGSADSAALLWQDDGFGRALLADVEAALESAGVEPVRGPGFDPRDPDWDAALDSLAAVAEPGRAVVFVGGFDSEFWPAVDAAVGRDRLASSPWFVTPSVLDPENDEPTGPELEFADAVSLTTAARHVEPNATTHVIDVLLEGRGGASVYDYAAYDAVRILAAAPAGDDLAGSARAGFAGAAAGYVGALGDVSLDEAGDLDSPAKYKIWKVTGTGWSSYGEVEPASRSGAPGGGCVVATAAYGTELAPQVQRLREARGALAGTEYGPALLSAFNAAYYAAAPAVADAQRQSPELNAAAGYALAPVLAILEAASHAGSGALAAAAGAMVVGSFAAAPAACACLLRRRSARRGAGR